MGISRYKVDGSKKIKIDSFPTDSKADKVDKEKILKKTRIRNGIPDIWYQR